MSQYRIRCRSHPTVASVAGLLLVSTSLLATAVPHGATRADEEHYPLERTAGIAVATADLPAYLAQLEQRATERAFLMNIRDLMFASGSAQVDVTAQRELARIAEFLGSHPTTAATIIGYTDKRGSDAVNLRLASERATAVKACLVGLGIAADRLTARGEGEVEPSTDHRSLAGRENNRRVAIFVQKTAVPTRE
jgi:outer membrane protein OmpA-like peptidoglycan-associated protein